MNIVVCWILALLVNQLQAIYSQPQTGLWISKTPTILWQHFVEGCSVSSRRSSREQPTSQLDETCPNYLEPHDRGAVNEENILDEPVREHVPVLEDSHVSYLSMASDFQTASFDKMNEETDCIMSFVQDVKQDKAKVIEHSNIYESNRCWP